MSFIKPKLIFFVTVDWFFCSHFLARAIAARKAGYEVIVLTRVERHAQQIESAGLRLIPLPIDRRSVNPFTALITIWHILQVYKREKATLVHQVALKPIVLGSIAARLAGVRNVVNAVVGGGYAFTTSRWSMRLLRPFLRFALRLLLNPRRGHVVFENADDLNSFVQAKYVRRDDTVLIRGAGVDPQKYHPRTASSDTPLIVVVARLLWDKGIGEFVEAARLLRARGIAARFAVIGDVDPDNRACIDLETLARWRAEAFVELWGFRSDIPEILGQAAIACLPSYREGLPKFLLEAMAASLPCVTTDVPGCREVVSHGDNGLLVPTHDPCALAQALEKLLLDPSLRGKMGQSGRVRLEQEFSESRIVKETLVLYQKLIEG